MAVFDDDDGVSSFKSFKQEMKVETKAPSRPVGGGGSRFRGSIRRTGGAAGTVKYTSGVAWAQGIIDDLNGSMAAATRVFRRAVALMLDDMQDNVPVDTGFLRNSIRVGIGSGALTSTFSSIEPKHSREHRLKHGNLAPKSRATGGFARRQKGGGLRALDRRRTGGGYDKRRRTGNESYKDPIWKARIGDRIIIQYLADYAALVHDGSSNVEARPWVRNAVVKFGGYLKQEARQEGFT